MGPYYWGMRIGGESKLKALFLLALAFGVACFACVYQASQTTDSLGWKVLAYSLLAVGSVIGLYGWHLAHQQTDDEYNSPTYDALRRLHTAAKLRNGQCRSCGAILPDDATNRLCSTPCGT
jgi:hypothetical protein